MDSTAHRSFAELNDDEINRLVEVIVEHRVRLVEQGEKRAVLNHLLREGATPQQARQRGEGRRYR